MGPPGLVPMTVTTAVTPRILVVVPTLGQRLDTLEPALASVTSQVGVSSTLVVVTPRDAKRARDVASRLGALILDDPGRGLSAAVNLALSVATDEEFFAWIGDDDELRPGGLALMAEMLGSQADAVVAFGGCDYMNQYGRVFATSRAGRWARHVLAWGPDLIPQPASLTRLEAIQAVGAYDESLQFAMDLDMFLRLRRQGRFLSTRRTVATYRWHPDALTVANRATSIREAEHVKRSHLPRRVRPLAKLWEWPVRRFVDEVSKRLTARARSTR